MSYSRYPEYRDSGVEWLGEVPSGWKTMALRRCLTDHRQGYYSQSDYVDEGVKLLRITDLGSFGEIDYSHSPKVQELPDLLPFLLKEADFVFARTGGAGTFGLVGSLTERVAYASYLIRFRFSEQALPGFLRHFFLSAAFTETVKQNIHGGVNQNIHAEDIKDQKIPLPPLPEQRQITAFLDRECAAMDSLVLKQERLIALLKEKRQALISHTVTKGLKSQAKLKDSGIEWLGEVPEGWATSRVGWVSVVGNGSTPKRDNQDYWREGTFPWLNSASVNQSEILEGHQFVTEFALLRCSLPILDPNTLLMAITGEGKTRGTTSITKIRCTLSQHVAFIRVNASKVIPDFLLVYLRANYLRIRFESSGGGSTKAAITCAEIVNYPVPLPPLPEQRAIVAYLDEACGKMDILVAKAESAITLLKERRTALISAAVTGKIDVRDL